MVWKISKSIVIKANTFFYFRFMITWQDFEQMEIRVGTLVHVDDFPQARNPAYKLTIDFGEYGIKSSSAQITLLYSKEELLHKQVIAVVNFPPKQIGNFMSECLVLGVVGNNKEVVLLQPERKVENGFRIS
jgi:tRNA-binding protein